jgi:uncharacterized ferredoxin-like protein
VLGDNILKKMCELEREDGENFIMKDFNNVRTFCHLLSQGVKESE